MKDSLLNVTNWVTTTTRTRKKLKTTLRNRSGSFGLQQGCRGRRDARSRLACTTGDRGSRWGSASGCQRYRREGRLQGWKRRHRGTASSRRLRRRQVAGAWDLPAGHSEGTQAVRSAVHGRPAGRTAADPTSIVFLVEYRWSHIESMTSFRVHDGSAV